MEDLLVVLAVFVIYCVYSVAVAIVLFKIFFPAVSNESLVKGRRYQEGINPQLQLFSFKTMK